MGAISANYRPAFRLGLAAILVFAAAISVPASAHPVEMLVPFGPGLTWYVCNDYLGHQALGEGGHALDLTSYHNTVAPYGCVYGNNSPAGKGVTAPGAGILTDVWSNGACFKFDAGGSIKLGHVQIGSPYNLQSKVDSGYHYKVGDLVSVVLPASPSENNNIAHLHTQAYSGTTCSDAARIPLSGSARLDCVVNMPDDGTVWKGTPMRRCEADVATFYDAGSGSVNEHVWTSNGSALAGAASWYSASGYTLTQVGDRFVSGDFNGNGKGDTATFYDYGSGSARIHVWLSTGSTLAYQGSGGWYAATGYTLAQIAGRFVSGDFNGDGKDDVAAFYDYGSGEARIHVWLSNGASFQYEGNAGWWSATGYTLAQVGDRFTVGDFDRDGKDDIAAMYDYGSNNARIHVWHSTGSAFTYSGPNGWWASDPFAFAASAVGARFDAGDFNADGRTDVAVFYNIGGGVSQIRVWLSTGSALTYQGDSGWYSFSSGYDLANVGARFLADDLNADGRDDIAAFYFTTTSRINVWLSTGTGLTYQGTNGWWASSYDLSKVSGRFVSGKLSGQ